MSELRAACFGRLPDRDGWPTVSVVVPVRNEADHLDRAVSSILAQDYPRPFDVCLAIAPSDDDTASVAATLAADHQRVTVVENPAGVTPAGLNAAIRATSSSIVVRVDGHAELSDGYIRRAVETMCATGAVNVGGLQVPRPETSFEGVVAAVTTSWVGTGGATYRVGGLAGPVDTVYLGVFDRAAGDAVGWFDESLLRNQDYEMNIRLREAGGVVWFDPVLNVQYRPRGSWRALGVQYYEYGFWKAEVLRRHPTKTRIRQLLPVAATVGCGSALVAAVVRRRALVVPAAYAAAIIWGARGHPARAGASAVMHFTWGSGFLTGMLSRRGLRAMTPANSAPAQPTFDNRPSRSTKRSPVSSQSN